MTATSVAPVEAEELGDVHLFGIRHHGPGSARSLQRALGDLQPDVVLLEAPAEAVEAFRWIGHPGLRPPVALLGYAVDQPQLAAFFPFAAFSPEWVALGWATAHGVEVRAIDLPLACSFALDAAATVEHAETAAAHVDPLRLLAAAAGDDDPERWWDDVVEHRGDGDPAFRAIAEAMEAVRAMAPPPDQREAAREASMRQSLRRARADGHRRIAVVCGAWHVPALRDPLGSAGDDEALLRGLPKRKVAMTWAPWTHRRLALDTGYGAGVSSPGWYAHVFRHPGPEGVRRWFVVAGHLLRSRGLSASPDHLIAGARLADALAALRSRPGPGLAEVVDAATGVLGEGGAEALSLVHDELIVGDALGTVPDGAPLVPLARDLAVQQRRLRLKPVPGERVIELDLRTTLGRGRSHLLHRLTALGVPWGALDEGRGSSGTFRETWRLRWEPELEIRLVELAGAGTTVAAATVRRLAERAAATDRVAELVSVMEEALLADLPEAIQPIVARLAARAAGDHDVAALMDAVVPFARALRYGDVRATDAGAIGEVFDGLVVRIAAGLPIAAAALDGDAAAAMVERLAATQAALALVEHPARRDGWPRVLELLAERRNVHGLVQGRATRLLHDSDEWDRERVTARLGRALTPGTAPAVGAAFVEGFLAGSGTVLVHDTELLEVIDGWVASLRPEAFVDVVPLLRRTFGGFEPAERRQLSALVRGTSPATASGFGVGIDAARAMAALATVRALLGLPDIDDRDIAGRDIAGRDIARPGGEVRP